MKKIIIGITLLFAVIAGVRILYRTTKKTPSPAVPVTSEIKATYQCSGDKTIKATFIGGQTKAGKNGSPPIPDGSVNLTFGNSQPILLAQTISADGSRYANKDESLVFWSRGNGAQVLENGAEKDYTRCIRVASDPGGLVKVYTDPQGGYSIRYPAGYASNSRYVYQGLEPDKTINGIQFTVPAQLTQGTNLSADSGVTVESLNASDCNANLFLPGQVSSHMVTDPSEEYSYASATQGAAGNQYEEDVWAIPGTNPCRAVRYFIHSTDIGNYPPGQVKEFDKTGLLQNFDKIRRTLVVK